MTEAKTENNSQNISKIDIIHTENISKNASDPGYSTVPTIPLCREKNPDVQFDVEETFLVKRPRPMHKKKDVIHKLEESGEEEEYNNRISTIVTEENIEASKDYNTENSEENIKEIKINNIEENIDEEDEDDDEGCLHENENIIFSKETNDSNIHIDKEEKETNKKNLEKDCAIERINIEQIKRSIISLVGIQKFNEIYNFYRNHIDVS